MPSIRDILNLNWQVEMQPASQVLFLSTTHQCGYMCPMMPLRHLQCSYGITSINAMQKACQHTLLNTDDELGNLVWWPTRFLCGLEMLGTHHRGSFLNFNDFMFFTVFCTCELQGDMQRNEVMSSWGGNHST